MVALFSLRDENENLCNLKVWQCLQNKGTCEEEVTSKVFLFTIEEKVENGRWRSCECH